MMNTKIFPKCFSKPFFNVDYIQDCWEVKILNSLPNNNILDWSKLKAFADEKMKLLFKLLILFLIGLKTLWEKEKMLVTSIFFFFLQCFQKGLPITRRQILDSSKLEEFADDNFKFGENGRKLSKQVENTVEKGEIARYEQFLLSHSVFKRLVSQGHQKVSLGGNGFKVEIVW